MIFHSPCQSIVMLVRVNLPRKITKNTYCKNVVYGKRENIYFAKSKWLLITTEYSTLASLLNFPSLHIYVLWIEKRRFLCYIPLKNRVENPTSMPIYIFNTVLYEHENYFFFKFSQQRAPLLIFKKIYAFVLLLFRRPREKIKSVLKHGGH